MVRTGLTICTLSRGDDDAYDWSTWLTRQRWKLSELGYTIGKDIHYVDPKFGRVDDFSKSRSALDKLAPTDWVLHLDADEYILTEVLIHILNYMLNEDNERTAFTFDRKNYFGDYEHVRIDSGCYPDTQCRLYNKQNFKWEGKVHESVKHKFCMTSFRSSGFTIHHFGWLKPIPFQEQKHARFHQLAGKAPDWTFPNLYHVQLRKVSNIKELIEQELR